MPEGLHHNWFVRAGWFHTMLRFCIILAECGTLFLGHLSESAVSQKPAVCLQSLNHRQGLCRFTLTVFSPHRPSDSNVLPSFDPEAVLQTGKILISSALLFSSVEENDSQEMQQS